MLNTAHVARHSMFFGMLPQDVPIIFIGSLNIAVIHIFLSPEANGTFGRDLKGQDVTFRENGRCQSSGSLLGKTG